VAPTGSFGAQVAPTLVSILETAKPRTAKTITELLTLPREQLKDTRPEFGQFA
jgi:hypothetical protein